MAYSLSRQNPQDAEDHSSNGRWPNRSRLEFGRIGGIAGAERKCSMKFHVKFLFILSALFLCAFFFFITNMGQQILRGRIPTHATGFQLDDIYMGAGLAPWVYMLIPSICFVLLGAVLLFKGKKKSN
jgi:hypothetical protein